MQTFLVAKIAKPSATIDEWHTLLVITNIPYVIRYSSEIHFVARTHWGPDTDWGKQIVAKFDHEGLFSSLHYSDIERPTDYLTTHVLVGEWKRLFDRSGLYSVYQKGSAGHGKSTYWLETPITNSNNESMCPLRVGYDRSDSTVFHVSMRD